MRPVPILPILILVLTTTACARYQESLVEPEHIIQLERNTEFDGANLRLMAALILGWRT